MNIRIFSNCDRIFFTTNGQNAIGHVRVVTVIVKDDVEEPSLCAAEDGWGG